jgi:AcrR family transcriptional regulator
MKPKSPKPKKFDDQLGNILKICQRLFAENGFNETSMEDIAQACKLQKATLYYYFKGKNDILDRIFQLEWNSTKPLVEIAKKPLELEEKLCRMGVAYLQTMGNEENVQFMKILTMEGLKRSSIHTDYTEFMLGEARAQEVFSALQAQARKGMKKDELELAIIQFFLSIQNYALVTKLMKNKLPFKCTDEEYARSLGRIFAKGLG